MSSTTSAGSGLASRWRKSSYSFHEANCLEAAFRKSSYSYSDGHCLEAAWCKSSYSTYNGNCTEAALQGGTVLVRDSKQAPKPGYEGPEGPHLSFSAAAWRAFTDGIKA